MKLDNRVCNKCYSSYTLALCSESLDSNFEVVFLNYQFSISLRVRIYSSLFADGNGRMGRLWQTLILARWNPLFTHVPVESLVHEHQAEYYQALQKSTEQTDAMPFIEFMLTHDSRCDSVRHPQVKRLLEVLKGDMTREELQIALNLQDRKSFRERYLKPALAEVLIDMTLPEKPNSRLQQ